MKMLMIFVVLLTGCVSPQMKEESRQAEAAYKESLNHTSITCPDKASCDKAYQLTKIYINENSDMKVQQSDDTTISTYNPIDWNDVGMSATKTPDKGETSVITIAVNCLTPICFRKAAKINNGFKPYVESRLK